MRFATHPNEKSYHHSAFPWEEELSLCDVSAERENKMRWHSLLTSESIWSGAAPLGRSHLQPPLGVTHLQIMP